MQIILLLNHGLVSKLVRIIKPDTIMTQSIDVNKLVFFCKRNEDSHMIHANPNNIFLTCPTSE